MALQSDKRLNEIWQGAFILTIAGIITKLLSAVYRIPYQNLAGDIGFYIYQQVYPFYGIALALSTYGFPVIISKMLAERLEVNDQAGAKKIEKVSLFFFLCVGIFIFCTLYFGAKYIALLMGDVELTLLLKVLSFTFLFLPVISYLRGYFQGHNNMKPTAISQVTEQFVRVTTIIVATYFLLSSGYNVYQVGAGAVFGSMTGGFCSILVLIAYWWKYKRKTDIKANLVTTIASKFIIKTLVVQGIMICISGMLLVLMQLVDAFSLYSLLAANGLEEVTAKTAKGVYDRGQPLIQLGTVVATSFSLSLVPLISSARIRRSYSFIEEKINLALRVAIVVGLGASVGLSLVIIPTDIMLFKNAQGSTVLMVLAFSILFTTLILTISAILQGLGYMAVPAVTIFLGLLLKCGLNIWLIPHFHTLGAAEASIGAYFIMAVILCLYLGKKQKINLNLYTLLYKNFIAVLIMVCVLVLFLKLTNNLFVHGDTSRLFASIQALCGVFLGGAFYMLAILKVNIFTYDELSLLPLGHKLVNLLEKNKQNASELK